MATVSLGNSQFDLYVDSCRKAKWAADLARGKYGKVELMKFEEAMAEAARRADAAVNDVMGDYAARLLTDEDDINGAVVGSLRTAFRAQPIAGLNWDASVVRHRAGVANEESIIGADIMMHVQLRTPSQSYSKGLLIQAKRVEPGLAMSTAYQTYLRDQCERMLTYSPAAFVINYTKSGVRAASATRIIGASERQLHKLCNLTSYRFFLEFFRCTTGDPRVTSALAQGLLIPHVLLLKGTEDLSK